MPSPEQPQTVERERTDESLRLEREKADQAVGDELSEIDQTADAVINKARARADRVLAAARAKMDRSAPSSAHGTRVAEATQGERALEDQILGEERAKADDILRAERAEHGVLLALEREATDKDLSKERTRSDDALATRDEFMGIVSHDLRNMLASVVGFTHLIGDAVASENHAPLTLKYVQRIERASARMNRLVGDLVDVASIEAGALAVTPELSDPALVVIEAVETLQAHAAASSIVLTAEIGKSILVAFDPPRILQVLINLISNAIKFTAAQGKVSVRVECADDQMCFVVRDTGMGIPADQLESIFVRFRQVATDRRGVGLGLYIAKCIVQGHGGRLWVDSKLGEGSTFNFTIPIHRT